MARFDVLDKAVTYHGTSHGHGADAARYVRDEVPQLRLQKKESVSAKGCMSLAGVTVKADWGPGSHAAVEWHYQASMHKD